MTQPRLTLFYDGSCPICCWEKHNLMRRDRRGLLSFIDIQSPEFDPSVHGVTMQTLMARMHGLTDDGRMIVGVDALIEAYRAVGWWWAYLPLSIVPSRLADLAYGWFADHRHELSRRFGHLFGPVCEKDTCRK
jgi:predicted DCC family thiol-disulfide oxidoreductase YuxK